MKRRAFIKSVAGLWVPSAFFVSRCAAIPPHLLLINNKAPAAGGGDGCNCWIDSVAETGATSGSFAPNRLVWTPVALTAGTVTQIRMYKGESATEFKGALYNSSGSRLGVIAASTSSNVGWFAVSLVVSAAVSAGDFFVAFHYSDSGPDGYYQSGQSGSGFYDDTTTYASGPPATLPAGTELAGYRFCYGAYVD